MKTQINISSEWIWTKYEPNDCCWENVLSRELFPPVHSVMNSFCNYTNQDHNKTLEYQLQHPKKNLKLLELDNEFLVYLNHGNQYSMHKFWCYLIIAIISDSSQSFIVESTWSLHTLFFTKLLQVRLIYKNLTQIGVSYELFISISRIL